MKTKLISFMALSTLALSTLAFATSLRAATFYECSSGKFEVSKGAARCYKSEGAKKIKAKCPRNHSHIPDRFNNNRDGCLNAKTAREAPIKCPKGYIAKAKPSIDSCHSKASAKPPSKRVQR